MNLHNNKKLILLFLSVMGLSYLAGAYFFRDTQPVEPFHQSASNLVLPQAMSIAPPSSFAELAKKVKPAVVNISTSKQVKARSYNPWDSDPFYRNFFQQSPQTTKKAPYSLGTGFIINEKGDILTNNHVIEGADEIVVKLEDGQELEAKVVGRDEKLDIAVIQPVKAGTYPFVTLGDSNALEVGDWVVAVGNPFGLGQTVTSGIVSAKARDIGAGPYDDFIQTDASINPGNSGGPLFNVNGEVVGINSAIIASGQGIGFAIPINIAKKVVPQLITSGKISRGWLGISMRDMAPEEAQKIGWDKPMGAVVTDVITGGPAAQAGLAVGDVIVGFAGTDIVNSHALPTLVADAAPGSSVTISFFHQGKKYERTLTLGSSEQAATLAAAGSRELLGMTVRDLSQSEAAQLRVQGVLVMNVKGGSVSESVGIHKGDLLLEVNGASISGVRFLEDVLSKTPSGGVMRLGLARGQQMYYFVFRKE